MDFNDIFFSILAWGQQEAVKLGMPSPDMDWLEKNGESICFQQTSSPSVTKAYIGGRKIFHVGFDILARGENSRRTFLVGYLLAYKELCLGIAGSSTAIDGYSLSTVDVTTPAIRTRDSNLITTYGISVGIDYEVN